MTEPVYRPIPFSEPMVRAILAGRKTRTRRLVRWPFSPEPDAERLDNLGDGATLVATDWRGKQHYVTCPTGGEGDRLWVREPFRLPKYMDPLSPAEAVAKFGQASILALYIDYLADQKPEQDGRYRPARFMPRALSRLTLVVSEDPDVERVQSISEAEAKAEGITEDEIDAELATAEAMNQREPRPAAARYALLWDSLNAKRGDWKSNPWVWVTKFLRA